MSKPMPKKLIVLLSLVCACSIALADDSYIEKFREKAGAGAPVSVSSILKDEEQHLKEMSEKSAMLFGDNWRDVFDKAFAAESTFFIDWSNNIKDAACLITTPR
jgi:hypothetical protein